MSSCRGPRATFRPAPGEFGAWLREAARRSRTAVDRAAIRSRSGCIPRARPAAEGHRAHARESVLDRRDVRPARARPHRPRRGVLGGQALLRVRPRQFADVPAVGRGDGDPHGRAADAGRGLQAAHGAQATVFFGVPTLLRRDARLARAAFARRRRVAPVRVGGRAAAEGDRRALRRAFRVRRARRHRLDRDAAHLHLQPRRAGCATAPPARRSRATTSSCAARTAVRCARRRDRRPLHPRAERRAHVLGQQREDALDVRGPVDAQRRQVRARRGRLLHLRRAAATTCSRWAGSSSRRSRSRRR